jgi:hypothetical protein
VDSLRRHRRESVAMALRKKQTIGWLRTHANGRTALVRLRTLGADEFWYSAMPQGEGERIGVKYGLEAAQAAADAAAQCPQPCGCSPWTEST